MISPILCNSYTHDSMTDVMNSHAEFADDSWVWARNKDLSEVELALNTDIERITNWCNKWNMSVAPDKTEVIRVSPKGLQNNTSLKIMMNGTFLKEVPKKKVLGVTIDQDLSFKYHIQEKAKAGFKALRGLQVFTKDFKGCCQSVFMRLYRALVVPLFDYAAAVLVFAQDECVREFGKVQRTAMLKASSCLSSTSTEALQVVTNCLPIDLHLRLRQAQELVRIVAKEDRDALKEDWNVWRTSEGMYMARPNLFRMLLTRFNELRGDLELSRVEKDFVYDSSFMGLSLSRKGKSTREEFQLSKDVQAENIKELLLLIPDTDILIFTDGSALINAGPTGWSAIVYLNGPRSTPVCLKKSFSSCSNNFVGELVGLQLGLNFLSNLDLEDRAQANVHFLTDCQPAITSVFMTSIPENNVELVLEIKEILWEVEKKKVNLLVHWCPGHMDIGGNELADRYAKEAAKETIMMKDDLRILTKKEASVEMKKTTVKKWQRSYSLSESVGKIQDIVIQEKVGHRGIAGEERKQEFRILNHLLCGHTLLNDHKAKVSSDQSNLCNNCQVPETTELFFISL